MKDRLLTPVVTLLTALLCSGSAVAGDVEKLVGPIPAEVDAFEATLLRFKERVAEIEADAQRAVTAQRDAQRELLASSYDKHIEELGLAREAQRREAIKRFETFLATYDDLEWANDVRLRLAELVFQEEYDTWFKAARAHSDAMNGAIDDLEALARLEEMGEPVIHLDKVVSLLDRIIKDNEGLAPEKRYALLDVAYYMLAFCYSDDNSAEYDRERARQTFRQLVVARPDSEYADAAHLILGNYLFEDGRKESLELAIPEFKAVIARGPERRHYSAAVYQLAWTEFKRNRYDDATRLFVQLLDESEAGRKAGRKASEYAKDSITYLALSLSDKADSEGVQPIDGAKEFFKGLGASRSYEWDVLSELADSLERYGRLLEAVAVLEELQVRPEFRLRPENPQFQIRAIRILSRSYDADLVAAGDARLKMTERYGEGSDWWNANRANPEAIAKASKFIESSLLAVANEINVRSSENNDPALASQAADKYREYLDRFPISDDFFDNQFMLADTLYRARRFDEAIKEYGDLLHNERFHPYGDTATYMLFRSWDQLMRDRIGPVDQPFEKAETERVYTSVGGVEVTVHHLEDTQRAFIQSSDQALGRAYGPPVNDLDAGGEIEKNRVKMMYLSAQVLFYANRFEEARPRLQSIIDQFPQTDEAAWAANLMLSSYVTEKDAAQVRKYSREYATLRLGGSKGVVESRAQQFKTTEELATFELAQQAAQKNDYVGAAEAFLSFAAEFPNSKNVPVALLNAADNYDRVGRAADANAIYERFIQQYPTHPEAKPYYFVIAGNYESTFELEKAISIYQQLVDRFPDYEQAPDAQFMVSFLKEGLGDKLGAAQGYETYARKYPTKSDRETVVFRAGTLYEAVDPERAIKFYRGYLSQYGTTNPDHAVLAQYRVASMLKAQGKSREASAALDEVVRLFDTIAAAGGALQPASRDMAAEAGFRALLAHHDRIVATQLARDEARDAKLLFETLRDEVEGFSSEARAFAGRYLSVEYSQAAAYLVGSAQAAYARLGLSVEPPKGLGEEDRDAYLVILEEQFYPRFYQVEDLAVTSLEQVLQLAKDQARHSKWVDDAYVALNRLRPDKYPAGKRTLPGSVEVSSPPELVPMSTTTPEVKP